MATDELTAEIVREIEQSLSAYRHSGSTELVKSHEALRADRDRLREERDAAQKAMSDTSEQAHLEWTRAEKLREEIAAKDAEIQRIADWVQSMAGYFYAHGITVPAAPADEGKTCAPMEDWRGANEDWRKR